MNGKIGEIHILFGRYVNMLSPKVVKIISLIEIKPSLWLAYIANEIVNTIRSD